MTYFLRPFLKWLESMRTSFLTTLFEGITILGVNGSMSGSEGVNPQAKEITPSAEEQVVLPDAGYNYLTQVTVKAIPYEESANSAGGKTATIG